MTDGSTPATAIDRGTGRVTPNLRATQVELYDGLVARSQNRFPSLRWDVGAVAGLAAPLLSAISQDPLLRDLKLPDFRDYAVDVETPGTTSAEATRVPRALRWAMACRSAGA